MAEKMFEHLSRAHRLRGEVRSAGIAASEGTPMSKHAASVMQGAGCPTDHQSRPLGQADADWADLILTMTQGHKRAILQMFPHTVDKVYTLLEYAWDDPDHMQVRAEWEALMAELQTKQALGEAVTAEERERLRRLSEQLGDDDIADPFGGTLEHYKAAADQIRQAVDKLIRKLGQEQQPGSES